VQSVEIFQGPDLSEPCLTLLPEDVPQFVAGLVATVMPGDLTADDDWAPAGAGGGPTSCPAESSAFLRTRRNQGG
jgi:hypothetical protein